MVEPNIGNSTKTANMTRRGSASPRNSKDWTRMSEQDPERRGSRGTTPLATPLTTNFDNIQMNGLNGSSMPAGTPSHDHPPNSTRNFWNGNPQPGSAFGRYTFPHNAKDASLSLRINAFLHSKMFKNLAILGTLAVFMLTILHSTQPELVNSGFRYLGNVSGLSRLAREEIKSLDDRLREFMSRPVLEQYEMELINRYNCPMYTYSRSTYFFHDGRDNDWHAVTHDQIRRYRNKMIAHLKEVEESGEALVWTPEYLNTRGGRVKRGIVLTGGEGSTVKRLTILLKMLRETLGCTLPIEMYHFPDEMQDPEVRRRFEAFGDVTIVELGGKSTNGKNWHIKNAAFLQSEFTEFIYMDSDNIPLMDPEEHFDSLEYKQSGSVFWADLYKDHPDNAIWRVLGRPCSDDHWPAEAGQVVFDKRGNNGLNLAVLHLSNHMMTNPDLYGFLSYGDKDTFRFSFYTLGLPYQQAPRIFASAGGFQTQGGEASPDYFCGHTMLQWGLTPWSQRNNLDFHPRPAFLHTILGKHRYNLDPAKLWSHIRRPRLDNITEPTLIRTLYEFTGDCFAITLKGPDGLPETQNSMRDGQGVLTVGLEEAFGDGDAVRGREDPVFKAVMEIAPGFVAINHND